MSQSVAVDVRWSTTGQEGGREPPVADTNLRRTGQDRTGQDRTGQSSCTVACLSAYCLKNNEQTRRQETTPSRAGPGGGWGRNVHVRSASAPGLEEDAGVTFTSSVLKGIGRS